MYNEGAAPGRVRKREAEEVSSLLWWLRGEGSVSLRNLCEVGDGEGSGNAHKRHPLVKRGRVWCLETSLERREMKQRKLQAILPVSIPLAHGSYGSWELSAESISWTCPQLTTADLPKAKPPSLEQPKYKDLSMQTASRPKPLSPTGDNTERSSRPQNCPWNWLKLVTTLQFNSLTFPSAQPAFLCSHNGIALKSISHWLCACKSPPSLLLYIKNWRVWDFYSTCKLTS